MKTALFHSCGREQPQFQLGAGGNCISISWRNHPKTSRELLEHGQRPPEPRCFPLSALALPGHIQLPRSFLLCLDGHSIVPLPGTNLGASPCVWVDIPGTKPRGLQHWAVWWNNLHLLQLLPALSWNLPSCVRQGSPKHQRQAQRSEPN